MRRTRGCLFVLALVSFAAAGLAPPALAADPPSFAVHRVVAEGAQVVVEVSSPGRPMLLEMASLTRNGSRIAGDVTVQQWVHREPVALRFTMGGALPSTATLVLVYSRIEPDDSISRREESHLLALRSSSSEDERRAVRAWDAWRDEGGNASFLLRSVGELSVPRVRASLQDATGAFAGAPFVHELLDLAPGESRWIDYQLVWEGNPYVLVLEYANRTETARLHLRNVDDADASGEANLTLRTDFPARETEPGGTAAFTLRLENGGGDAVVTLRVRGLPDGFGGHFTVQGSRTTSFRAPEGTTRDVTLGVDVPSSATAYVGQSIPLVAEVLVDGEVEAAAELVLSVHGRGGLELSGQNWFVQGSPGQPASVDVEVRNPGTAPLFDVDLLASVPTGWDVAFEPRVLPRLDARSSLAATLTVTPPPDVAPGRYVLDVSAATEDLSSRARSLTVSVAAPASSSLPWIASAAVAGLLAVGLIVKLRRK